MAKYLHKFDMESAFNAAYNGNDYHEPWVSYTDETEGEEHVDYNKVPVEYNRYVDMKSYDMSYTEPMLLSEFMSRAAEFPNVTLRILYTEEEYMDAFPECSKGGPKTRSGCPGFLEEYPAQVTTANGEAELVYWSPDNFMTWLDDGYQGQRYYFIDYPD